MDEREDTKKTQAAPDNRLPNTPISIDWQDVKPVMSMKTAAGPGGLKKSPSPVQSPDNAELPFPGPRHSEVSMGASSLGSSLFGSSLEQSYEQPGAQAALAAAANVHVIEGKKAAGQLNFALRYDPEKSALQV